MKKYYIITLILVLFSSFLIIAKAAQSTPSTHKEKTMVAQEKNIQLATFAGGCFWCMEPPFESIEGVSSVISGYSGGDEISPSYKEVSAGKTGHLEVIQVSYNPQKITYETLLDTYWRQIDPTDAGGSFVDRGKQYRSAIFYHNAEQQQAALNSKKELEESGRFNAPLVTEIVAFKAFYPAEDYHQDYHSHNPIRYYYYRSRSGRDDFIEKAWAQPIQSKDVTTDNFQKPSDSMLKQKLSALQYSVTQEEGTEPAFNNSYWDNKSEGLYVDIVSGEALFSSRDKFESGTGWPSFTKPINQNALTEHKDQRLFFSRTEIRSKLADSHLGHVFDDGPEPTGLRYCVNSASLRFIAKENLLKEGYDEYSKFIE